MIHRVRDDKVASTILVCVVAVSLVTRGEIFSTLSRLIWSTTRGQAGVG